jgi:hypothetical protein
MLTVWVFKRCPKSGPLNKPDCFCSLEHCILLLKLTFDVKKSVQVTALKSKAIWRGPKVTDFTVRIQAKPESILKSNFNNNFAYQRTSPKNIYVHMFLGSKNKIFLVTLQILTREIIWFRQNEFDAIKFLNLLRRSRYAPSPFLWSSFKNLHKWNIEITVGTSEYP